MDKLFGLAFLTLILLCCGIKTNTLQFFIPPPSVDKETVIAMLKESMALFPSSSLYKTYSKNGCRRVACISGPEDDLYTDIEHGYLSRFSCLISYLDGRAIESKEISYYWTDGSFHAE